MIFVEIRADRLGLLRHLAQRVIGVADRRRRPGSRQHARRTHYPRPAVIGRADLQTVAAGVGRDIDLVDLAGLGQALPILVVGEGGHPVLRRVGRVDDQAAHRGRIARGVDRELW